METLDEIIKDYLRMMLESEIIYALESSPNLNDKYLGARWSDWSCDRPEWEHLATTRMIANDYLISLDCIYRVTEVEDTDEGKLFYFEHK